MKRLGAPSRLRAALLLALAASGAEAKSAKKTSPDPRTRGLGHSCQQTSQCRAAQKCIKQVDAKGKSLERGFCVLPCASFEAGTTKVAPGAAVDVTRRKKPAPRCPPKYQCRSAGAGVPIDMCVKE